MRERFKRLRKMMAEKKCDLLIVDGLTNLFYLTGQQMSAGKLLVGARSAKLFVDGRYIERCKKEVEVPSVLTSPEIMKKEIAKAGRGSSLGFDSAETSYNDFLELKALVRGTGVKLVPVPNFVQTLRAVKDDEEIKLLREASVLGSEGYDYLLGLIKPGVTELQLAKELEIYWLKRGSRGVAFESIIAFGSNSSMPHYRPNPTVKLKKGQPVLIDIGVNDRHYNSDMTRVVFCGKASSEMKKIYEVVRIAQEKALLLCKPGAKIGDIDAAARGYIESQGYGKYFTHNLGHGVGIDIHEQPWMRKESKVVLEKGMVITIEPGVYLPDVGGVRIEDTVLITAKGHENLTNRPKDLIEICR